VLALTGRRRAVLLAFTGIAIWWSAFVTFVYAVKPGVRYEYMPFIREADPVQLWLELGRVLRPDIQTALPSFYGHEAATPLLALVWVALAAALGVLGFLMTRRTRTVKTSAL
jgi:hypothetical protein